MRLARRVRMLEALAPPARRGPDLPRDPVAFARAFLAREFTAADIDRTDPDHMGWLCRLQAFLVTLSPAHQAWLRAARELHPRAYPDALLLPATDDEILAALDAVMRRG